MSSEAETSAHLLTSPMVTENIIKSSSSSTDMELEPPASPTQVSKEVNSLASSAEDHSPSTPSSQLHHPAATTNNNTNTNTTNANTTAATATPSTPAVAIAPATASVSGTNTPLSGNGLLAAITGLQNIPSGAAIVINPGEFAKILPLLQNSGNGVAAAGSPMSSPAAAGSVSTPTSAAVSANNSPIDPKILRRRERNREAARECRKKRKVKEETLHSELNTTKEEVTHLKEKLKQLAERLSQYDPNVMAEVAPLLTPPSIPAPASSSSAASTPPSSTLTSAPISTPPSTTTTTVTTTANDVAAPTSDSSHLSVESTEAILTAKLEDAATAAANGAPVLTTAIMTQ